MSTDPVALSAVLNGSPNEADYDALYVALMATERGRRFLGEYADRNRHADTHTLVAAMARVEAAVRGDPAPRSAAVSSRDLTDIAAAIDHVAALVAPGAAEGSDGGAAAERMADIAFVLHEREVEPSLCDALDAAVRKISETFAHNQANAERAQKAAELLRELSRRISELGALSGADHSMESAENAKKPESPSPAAVDAMMTGGAIGRPHSESLAEVMPNIESGVTPIIESSSAADDANPHPGSTDLFNSAPQLSSKPAVSPPASDDPLAPIRALSDEEMIALFS